jgi:hypothetical protein
MRVQISLNVAEAKRLIARAVVEMPEVRAALVQGKLLLKGGTTVSAVSERLAGPPLRISGRISPRGTMATAGEDTSAPHTIIIEGGVWRSVDESLVEESGRLGPRDVIIIGANAIDASGGAAMMAGSQAGGTPGLAMSALWSEGAAVIIPAGLEKLIPGTIQQAVRAAGRRGVDRSLGMAVGLIPLIGQVVTELDALTMLAAVRAVVIGRGGIAGGEGSTVMAVEGEPAEVDKIFTLVESLKGSRESGEESSLAECRPGGPRCRLHLGCVYKHRKEDSGA